MNPTNEKLTEHVMTAEFCRKKGFAMPTALIEAERDARAELTKRELKPAVVKKLRKIVGALAYNEVSKMIALQQASEAPGHEVEVHCNVFL